MSHQKDFSQRRSTEILLCAVIIIVFAVTALLAARTVNKSRFDRGSEIAGLDVSGMEPAAAAAMLDEALDALSIRLTDGEGELLGEAALTELLGEIDIAGQTEAFLQQQNTDGSRSFAPGLLAEGLEERLEPILFPEGFVPEEPRNAEFVMDEEGARIEPETRGNIPDTARCAEVITDSLSSDPLLSDGSRIWEIRIDDPYVKADVTADDASLNAQLDILSAYTDTKIELLFCGGRTHTMTPHEILRSLDITLDGEDTTAVINEAALEEVLGEIIEALGADGVEAKYGNVRPTREYVYLLATDTGFPLDRAKLTLETAALLEGCTDGSVEGSYDYTWWLRKTYGWMGNVENCVEISIDNQYVWFYQDGKLVTETEVVTGDIATLCDTPRGAFRVSYKTADTFLVGPTWNDHVDYWIPYYGNYGIHDSDWRDEYGGDIYKTSGSHGCINTPLEPMSIIYEGAYVGMVVIVR